MATSSIFHNVIINNPKKADAFISAMEASIADPYRSTNSKEINVESDPDIISRILELWNKEVNN